MAANQYSWFAFAGKIVDFFKFIFDFFRGRKAAEAEKQEATAEQVQTNYAEIDKEKEAKKQDELNKRLNNMF